MRSFIFGFVPFCLFMIWGRWYYVCKVQLLCGDNQTELITGNTPSTLSLNSGEETILSDYNQFRFPNGSMKPRLSKNNNEFLDKVADYLKTKEDKSVTITGNYLEKEKEDDSGFFENLGQARAAEIRELLKERGINEDRFTIDYNDVDQDRLLNSLSFDVFDSNAGAKDEVDPITRRVIKKGERGLAKMKFTFHDMTFSDDNFATDSDEFNPGKKCQLYADSVNTYLNLNPKSNLTIIGHTDSRAGKEYNDDLGLRRAKSAKAYFKKLGVKSDINVASMGEQQPVDTNDTPKGRQKNRRVNFLIE